ncbi:MAG: ribosome-associated translation inhibitor RaiA [bacterium]|nr:ribosome-associated translation inhibitor RaiA [bacterium]MCP4965299.1 ribosome-associated translation inhibitor RaiA [bacterium]
MDVRVHGKNMRVEEAASGVAHDKIGHASRIFDDGSVADVEFSELKNPRSAGERYKVEITSHIAGHTVRVESVAPDQFSAVDLSADKFERQLRRLKERLIQRSRTRDHKTLNDQSLESDEEQEDGPLSIVRTKRFEMRPMTAEEAGLQMEMLGHNFFFFLDAESGKYCVLYHRDDGNLGLIEPA